MLWPAEFWATLLSIVERDHVLEENSGWQKRSQSVTFIAAVRQTYAMKQIEFNKFALKSATARCLGPFPRFLLHEDHIPFETLQVTGQ